MRKEVMTMAWTFVKSNGIGMGDAMRTAWRNVKLRSAMKDGIVNFVFRKVDGTVREAYGTLKEDLIPETGESDRKRNDTVQVYFDTEKNEWRCFKKANLMEIR